jgi:predicted nucleic acid-binding protein
MKVLLDTCVLSEIRRSQGLQVVKDTVAALPDRDIFLSAITIGEIIKGISLLKDTKQKAHLENWVECKRRGKSGTVFGSE